MASKRSSTKRLVTSERVYTSKDKLNVPLALCHCANCKCVTCKVFFFLSPHVRPWHCRKRPCRGAERTTWRGKRSPPTSRGRWATSRPKSRSTAPATPSCARRTAPWQRSWRGSYRSTTSERRYWSWHARTGSKQRLKSGSINPNLHANPPDITWAVPHTFGRLRQSQTCELLSHFTHVFHLLAALFQFYAAKKLPEQEMKQSVRVRATHKSSWLSSRTWRRSSSTETWKKSCWRPNSRRPTCCCRRPSRSTSWRESSYVPCIRFVEPTHLQF